MLLCEVPGCGALATHPTNPYWAPWACEEHWAEFLVWRKEALNR